MVRYDRIWELCKETGKKRSFLSKAMGHSERYLLDARKQNTNIKTEELLILASELNTSIEYLKGETDEKSPPPLGDGLSETRKELINKILALSDDDLQKLSDIVDLISKGWGK